MFPLDAPSDDGLVEFVVPAAPVSFQSSARSKAAVVEAIRARTHPCRYLLSGDVKLSIRWHVSQRVRYEGDGSADVDNIIKPIADALSGVDGVMIDDCQIQELTCYWTDQDSEAEKLSIELRSLSDEYVMKDHLVFLHVGKGLYYPLSSDIPPPMLVGIAESVIERAVAPDLYLRPVQRVFHRSRINGFRTSTLDELRARLDSSYE